MQQLIDAMKKFFKKLSNKEKQVDTEIIELKKEKAALIRELDELTARKREKTIPKRIQRKRTKGWRMPENTVYVGRPSKWADPHKITDYHFESDEENRAAAVKDFLNDLETGALNYSKSDIKSELRGKNLACWCPEGGSCHADVLLEIANQ